jgi:hypothetical protein
LGASDAGREVDTADPAALAWSSDIVPDLGETLRFIDNTRQAGGP